jgi:A/G-specific adenine glycosylase
LRNANRRLNAGRISRNTVRKFQRAVYAYFHENERELPWRLTSDPYKILVSEFMLQQTQVQRVIEKYGEFITRFTDFAALARSRLRDVLAAWQGLGYNRRALSIQQTAQRVVTEFNGRLPDSVATLETLPGIGPATAGALVAFAFEQPVVFIETNIRRVFIHFFFPNRTGVTDREILPLVEQTMDRDRVRTWYYALMDYGAVLPKVAPNPNRRSAHHHRQGPFLDSNRQIRGLILKALLANPHLSEEELVKTVAKQPERTRTIINHLVREGFLDRRGNQLRIATAQAVAET